MGDVDDLAGDLRAQLIPLPRHLHVAYFLRFDASDLAATTAGRTASTGGWSTSVYNDRRGRVLRLTRESLLTTQQLDVDRRWLHWFARLHGARWDAMVIEELRPDDFWDDFARRFFLHAAPELKGASPRRRDTVDREGGVTATSHSA